MPRRRLALLLLASLGLGTSASAQWNNRYPKVGGLSHHVYLEGYELPILTNGPMDVAAAPDGKRLAFASRGWLWTFDIASGVATRLTKGAAMDARPAWSPDGTRIAFVRDNGSMLSIVMIDVASGAEQRLVGDSAVVLDPVFSADGASLFYSSAIAGDLDLWRLDVASRATTRITSTLGTNELNPVPTPDGLALIYLAKTRAGADQLRRRVIASGEETSLASGGIVSMTRAAVSPDGRILAYTWPTQAGYELRVGGTGRSGESFEILRDPRVIPLAPAFSRDGATIWYSHADAQQRMHLARVPTAGGPAVDVTVKTWDWGVPTARLRIATHLTASPAAAAARVAVATADGHQLPPDSGQVRFDGQSGIAFFYSRGAIEVTVPAGEVTVSAVQGLATPLVSRRVTVRTGTPQTVSVTMTPVWDARASGWRSGDHHFHLNYGGPYRLEPETLTPMGLAEGMDVLTPMLANLSHRFEDQPLFTYRRTTSGPWVLWAQEVRSHFLGHVGLINTSGLFWPWVWGPGYDLRSNDDRPNSEPLAFARQHGGISTYVHPVGATPFESARALRSIPLGFVADAVQGNVDAIELACLWSDERGSADLWYRVLNVGVPMALNAGTDVMNNLYRTMAVGATRIYVHPDRPSEPGSYFTALKAGRSFVSTGPMLEFTVGRAGPGQVVARGNGTQRFELEVHSAVPIDSVQIIVNGAVVSQLPPFTAPGSRRYTGTVDLPVGGWVAARVSGPSTRGWPAMSSYAFAHTSPVWIDRVGSTEPRAKQAAARDLLQALDVADQAVEIGYAGSDHPRILAHYAAARRRLNDWVAGGAR